MATIPTTFTGPGAGVVPWPLTEGWGTSRFATGLAVTGLAVTGLAVTGLAVTGLAVTGLAVTGLAVTGLAVTGLAVTGLAVTGLAVTGLAVTGLSAAGPVSGPGRRPRHGTVLRSGSRPVRFAGQRAGVAWSVVGGNRRPRVNASRRT